jgi:molybdopterin converting factor small subunit
MKVRVRLFAYARATVGLDILELDVPAPATIGEVRRAVGVAAPKLLPGLPYLSFAVNREYASDGASVGEDDDIACIPPPSGG